MFGKKIFLLAAGYIAGNVVSSLYNNKKGKDVQTALKKAKKTGEDEKKVLIDNVVNTQRNFFEDLKKNFFTEENKNKILAKKDDFMVLVDTYTKDSEKFIADMKKLGKDHTATTQKKVEKMYQEAKTEITKKMKDISPETMDEIKGKLLNSYEDIKKTIVKNTKK